MENNGPIIDVCGKRTIEYVFECISKYNNNHDKIRLRAYGSNINKGVEIVQILKDRIGVLSSPSLLDSIILNDVKIPYIEIPIQFPDKNKIKRSHLNHCEKIDMRFQKGFLNYSTYHLLLDWYFNQSKQIEIKNDKNKRLLTIFMKDGEVAYRKGDFDFYKKADCGILNKINSALYRCGIVMPHKWQGIAHKLSHHDDVILGVDTNILYNCTISEHLLPAVTFIESAAFIHTPNWILLAIPATVMYELEEAANIRCKNGRLTHQGRMAFRALQEIIELTNNIDIPGVSLLIVGEADSTIDTKTSLRKINENIYKLGMTMDGIKDILHRNAPNKHNNNCSFKGIPVPKSSSGDMAIRNQFKKFLRQIDFHKGTYFLTADKSNSALAMAEGLNPILISQSLVKNNGTILEINKLKDMEKDSNKELKMNIPLGNIIYEMAVSFGSIHVSYKDKTIVLNSDKSGKELGRWLHKQLIIRKRDLETLMDGYNGECHLKLCVEFWKKLIEKFEDIKCMPDMQDVFYE